MHYLKEWKFYVSRVGEGRIGGDENGSSRLFKYHTINRHVLTTHVCEIRDYIFEMYIVTLHTPSNPKNSFICTHS